MSPFCSYEYWTSSLISSQFVATPGMPDSVTSGAGRSGYFSVVLPDGQSLHPFSGGKLLHPHKYPTYSNSPQGVRRPSVVPRATFCHRSHVRPKTSLFGSSSSVFPSWQNRHCCSWAETKQLPGRSAAAAIISASRLLREPAPMFVCEAVPERDKMQ